MVHEITSGWSYAILVSPSSCIKFVQFDVYAEGTGKNNGKQKT